MRLPWPFGRRTSPDGPPSAATESGGTGTLAAGTGPTSTDPAAPSVAPAAAPTGAWTGLPPIQRTVGAPPLVAPSAPFLDGVSGVRPLPPIVEPLGHEASASAPPGLVVAHARPAPTLTSTLTSTLPMPPVQRRVAHDTDHSAPAGDELQAHASAPGPEPARQLAIVPPGSAATPPAVPLTRTASTLAPLPVPNGARGAAKPPASAAPGTPVQRAAVSPAAPVPGSSSATPGPATGTSRWAESPGGSAPGLGAPLRGPTLPPAARRQLTEPAAQRRAGLGLPLAVPPASAVAQRLPTVPLPAPGVSATAIPAPDADHGTSRPAERLTGRTPDGGVPGPSAGSDAATGRRGLPVLPVVRQRSTGAEPGTTTAAMPVASGPAPAAGGAHPGPTTRPTLGARPLRPATMAQREAAQGATGRPATADLRGGAPGGAPVTAHWDTGDGLPATVVNVRPSPEPPAIGAELPVQLMPLDAAASSTPVVAPGAALREITFPARDGAARSAGWSSPAPASAVQRLPAAAGGRPQPPTWPIAQDQGAAGGHRSRDPQAALTLAHPAAAAQPAPAAVAPALPVVGRIVADSGGPSSPPSVQASHGGGSTGGTPVAAISTTPVVQRVEGAAPEPDSQGGGHTDPELDELARALFGRIRSHLRAEVIHEREAKGLTFDAF